MTISKQKTMFRNKKIKVMKQMMIHSQDELSRYEKRHALIHLRQSGEKIYNAYLHLVEAVSYTEVTSHHHAAKIVQRMNDKDIINLGTYAEMAHVFFYEGQSTSYYVSLRIREAYKIMKKIIKKKNLYVKNV